MKKLASAFLAVALAVGAAAPAHAQLGGAGAKDIMFAIDTTTSMDRYIDQTKAAADSLAERLVAADGRSRVGLVEYRDVGPGNDFTSRTVTPLTTNFNQFRTGLYGLRLKGGGTDLPETVYSGIARAMCADWAADRTRAIIVIGDGAPKDPEPGTGLTAQNVIDLARGNSNANPFCPGRPTGEPRIFVVTADDDVARQLEGIVRDTGGRTVSVENTDQIAGAIESVVDQIDSTDLLAGSITETLPGLLDLSVTGAQGSGSADGSSEATASIGRTAGISSDTGSGTTFSAAALGLGYVGFLVSMAVQR